MPKRIEIPGINGCRVALYRRNGYLQFLRNVLCALALEKKLDGSSTACQESLARRGYFAGERARASSSTWKAISQFAVPHKPADT